MTSDLILQQHARYKDRRGWLVAFGIFEILIAGLCLMILALVIVALSLPQSGQTNSTQPNQVSPAVGILGSLLVYGGAAAAFLTIGIGSIRCRNWARIAMLVLSGFWLVSGVFSVLAILLVMPTIMRQQGTTNPAAQNGVFIGLIIFMTIFMIVPPAVFLVFYTRKSVKATCLSRIGSTASATIAMPTANNAAPTASIAIQTPTPETNTHVPVPLIILAVWQGFGVFAPLGFLALKSVFVFGMFLHGAPAIMYGLTISALCGYAAWSTFHQKLVGWEIGLYMAIFGIASFVTTFAGHDPMQIYRQMGLNEDQLRIFSQFPQMASFVWIISLVGFTGFFAFIVYTRKFFANRSGPESEASAWRP